MAGYRTWAYRDTFTHHDVNNFLMGQVIARFSSTTARNAQMGTPVAGQVSYIIGTGLQIYTGTAWVNLVTPAYSTAGRPSSAPIGTAIFDTTLGQPVWWNGTAWTTTGLTGPAGPAGPAGATGAVGANGPPGDPATNLVTSVAGRQGVVTLVKADVGLSNVDNTSDASKPVSTAQATADALALPKAGGTMTGLLSANAGISIAAGQALAFSGDTSIYRDAADILRTNDALRVDLNINANHSGGAAGVVVMGAAGPGSTAGITLGTDVNVYRSAANVLATDDDFAIATAGKGLKVKEGSNAKMGVVTLVAGTATVNTTAVTATSRVVLTGQEDGGTPGFLRVSARTAGTSFTITSGSATDTSTVMWFILDPA